MKKILLAAMAALAIGCGGGEEDTTPTGGQCSLDFQAMLDQGVSQQDADYCNTCGPQNCCRQMETIKNDPSAQSLSDYYLCLSNACPAECAKYTEQIDSILTGTGECVVGSHCPESNLCDNYMCVGGGTTVTPGNPTAPACGPDNCDGCCVGDTCYAGTEDSACGSDGLECTTCNYGEWCSGGCVTSPMSSDSRWKITVYGATVYDKDLNGASWDEVLYTEPDPYVCLVVGTDTECTMYQNDTYGPIWDSSFTRIVTGAELVGGKVSFQMWDYDGTEAADYGGSVDVVQTDVPVSGEAHSAYTLRIDTRGIYSVIYYFTPAPAP